MDERILIWIQENLRNDIMTYIMKFITFLGDKGLIWIIITILLLCSKKYRKVGVMSTIALLSSLLICNLIIKNIVDRPRPYDTIENLVSLKGKLSDYSFPSAHTSAAFATGVIYLKKLPKRYGITMFIFAFIMAASRMYLGVHYLTDVLGGAVVGTIIGILVMIIYEQKLNRKK